MPRYLDMSVEGNKKLVPEGAIITFTSEDNFCISVYCINSGVRDRLRSVFASA